ncbi:efflux RND transporter periplasmic adaptor subunit [Sediminibacterium soli]|uniref:efflux RND transporter periplasmic adaptor subunit n=1 Tax=Sediminibacterium soli TaxID=2698829 RepID=UPI00137AA4BF|nr:efflux RND transporter periplasmic adaptor subunit [Sediminibacterium soli]NCI46234.1 efflux RND transporter periplasmic adaptor subunit [Sediminibacterium soli]
MKRISYPIAFIGIVVFTACKQHEQAPAVTTKTVTVSDSMATRIKLDTVSVSHISSQLRLSGEVGFDENKVIKLFPFSSGQVTEVKVSLGDKVSAGQVLAVIKSADIAGNYSDLRQADADVSIAKREMDNQQALYEKGISSEREYTIAKENYQKALAANAKLNDQIRINGGGRTHANGLYYITAPAAGYIVEKNVNAGNYIRNDNSSSLFTVSNLSDVWVLANVFEADIPKVKEGYDAEVTTLAYPGKVFRAKIDKISEVLDPMTKAMKVRIRIPNEGFLLKPEMFTTVTILNQEADTAVSVPSEAVIFDNSKKFVVLYHNRSRLEIREVQVLKTVNTTAYIASGLAKGDLVISRNQLLFYRALLEQ